MSTVQDKAHEELRKAWAREAKAVEEVNRLRERLAAMERERDEARAALTVALRERDDLSRAIEDTLPEVRALREASRAEQRCDACDAEREARGATVCACSLADLRRALAEQAAGEAERTAQAVAREREACADLAFELAGDGGSLATWRAIRARATSPAPEASPEPVAAEREALWAVVEAAEAWRASLDGPGECWHEARMREAVDALAAARKGG